MSYRSVYLRKAEQLRLKDNCLLVIRDNEAEPLKIPLEDISLILVEDRHTMFSSSLIGELARYYIGMIFVDEKYQPASLCMPLYSHYKQLYVFQKQMEVKKPVYNQCWQQIVKAKVRNQIISIMKTTNDEYTIDRLQECVHSVQSDDKTNVEANAARTYFGNIFGPMFRRNRNLTDPINLALNYGYTIISSNMIRVLCCYGFNCTLGIHHESYTNNFNLAFDLIEPFRPIVDIFVYEHKDILTEPLLPEHKKALIGLLHETVRIDGKNYMLENAQEIVAVSLQKVVEQNDSKYLLLPEIIN